MLMFSNVSAVYVDILVSISDSCNQTRASYKDVLITLKSQMSF